MGIRCVRVVLETNLETVIEIKNMSILQTRNPTSGIYPIEIKGCVYSYVFTALFPVAPKLSGEQMNESEHLHPGILCSLRMSE